MSVLDIALQSARGAKSKGLAISVVRELTRDDLAVFDAPDLDKLPAANPLVRLRHKHHLLARLMAEGRMGAEISLITGYSSSYLSTIQHDPAFKELVSYYEQQTEALYANVHERRAALGLSAVEELQDRVDNQPDTFSNREMMELMEKALDPGAKAAGGGGGGGISVNISFVKPEERHDDGHVIDVTPSP